MCSCTCAVLRENECALFFSSIEIPRRVLNAGVSDGQLKKKRMENLPLDGVMSANTYTYEIDLATMPGVVTRADARKKGVQEFLSVDPLTRSYPMLTPYQFASNTPIQAIDLDGLEALKVTDEQGTVVVTSEKMTSQHIAYRQNFRFAVSVGYGFQEAHYYAQLVQGNDPISRSLSSRIASGGMPNISGGVNFSFSSGGLSGMADDVAQFTYDALMPVLLLPLETVAVAGEGIGLLSASRNATAAFKASKSVSTAYKAFTGGVKFGRTGENFIQNPDLFIRGTSFLSNLNGQMARNASTESSGINVFESFMSIASPRHFGAQGVASGVGVMYHPFAESGQEFSFNPSLERAVKGAGIGVGMQHLTGGMAAPLGVFLGQTLKPTVSTMYDATRSITSGETSRN